MGLEQLIRFDARDYGLEEPIVLRVSRDTDTLMDVAERCQGARTGAAHWEVKEETYQLAVLLASAWVSPPLPGSHGSHDDVIGSVCELSRISGQLITDLISALNMVRGKGEPPTLAEDATQSQKDATLAGHDAIKARILNWAELVDAEKSVQEELGRFFARGRTTCDSSPTASENGAATPGNLSILESASPAG